MVKTVKAVLAAVIVVAAPALSSAGDGAPGPGVSGEEREALSQALEYAGLTLEDLKFRKDVAGTRLTPAAVTAALTDPLEGVRIADELACALSSSGPEGCLTALMRVIHPEARLPEEIGPSSPPQEGADRAAYAAWLAPLAPAEGFGDEDLDRIAVLPGPVKEALGWFVALLPAADSELSEAFLDLSEHEMETLRQYGLMLSIADDEIRDRFMPPDPVKAAALLTTGNRASAMTALLEAAAKVETGCLCRAGALMARLASGLRAALEGAETPGFGDGHGYALDLKTRFGAIRFAGRRNDVHEQGCAFLIDLGGDDVYRGVGFGAASALTGRRLSLLLDLDGADVYISSGRVQLGAAFMGAAAFLDCRGNDVYMADDVSLGAAIFGAALLVDDGGHDSFRGREFCQGAAAFGAAALLSDRGGPGNDNYTAQAFSQGLARTMAAAALVDWGGHDSYTAGSGRLYRPQSKTRHYSHSQGFAIGFREFGVGGGVAILLDCDGNDVYNAEIHAQGSACWMGLGILVDLRGDDRYACTFNGQGAAVHQSVGILVDGSGDDSYTIDDGIGQGAAHDFAVGVLCDRGGNDKYMGRAAVQGVGLTDGVGILIDRSGDDVYAAHSGHYQGAARPTRNFRSIGVLVDLGGRDTYTAGPESLKGDARADSRGWARGSGGAGLDSGKAPSAPPPDQVSDLPEDYEFNREKFDGLFATASLWVVGENVGRTAAAKAELAQWGARALPFLRAEMGKWGTLHFWGLDAVVASVHSMAPEETEAMVLGCFGSGDGASQANALRLSGKLKIQAAAPTVLSMLGNVNWASFAVWPAGQLRIAAAVPALAGILESRAGASDATEAVTALCKIGGPAAIKHVLSAFLGGDFAAREAAVAHFWRFGPDAAETLVALAAEPSVPRKVRVAAARALSRFAPGDRPDNCDETAIALLKDQDWAVRSAAAMLAATGPKPGDAARATGSALKAEKHPYALTAFHRALMVASGESGPHREPVSGVVDYPILLEDD